MRPLLAEGQVAAENRQSGSVEGLGQRHQQQRVAVGSRAVRQDEAVSLMDSGLVQEASNSRPIIDVKKLPRITHTKSLLQDGSPVPDPTVRLRSVRFQIQSGIE